MEEEGIKVDNPRQNGPELRKDLGLVAALSLVVGMVLGAGAFMKPPAVLSAAGDSSSALLAWAIGGVLSMAGGLTLCELGVLFPRTGGVYVYLEELYGEKTAFLYGWVIMTVFGPATIGALCGYFSSVFCLLFDLPARFAPVVAAGVLAFVLIVNSINVRAAGKLQTAATFCKLIPIALLAGFGLWQGNGQVMGVTAGVKTAAPFSVAVLATLFAYDGWSQVASVAGEMKNPGQILPRAIIGGVFFLCLVYAMINVAFLKVLPADQIAALGHDASAIIAQQLFGLSGGNLIAVGIMISILGGLNGYIMTLSRTIFVLAERKQIPGYSLWQTIDADSQSPLNAMFLLVPVLFLLSVAGRGSVDGCGDVLDLAVLSGGVCRCVHRPPDARGPAPQLPGATLSVYSLRRYLRRRLCPVRHAEQRLCQRHGIHRPDGIGIACLFLHAVASCGPHRLA